MTLRLTIGFCMQALGAYAATHSLDLQLLLLCGFGLALMGVYRSQPKVQPAEAVGEYNMSPASLERKLFLVKKTAS